MTSWMKERDRLVEQTLAFVQGVAAQRPVQAIVVPPQSTLTPALVDDAAVTKPQAAVTEIDLASTETDALITMMALSQPAQSDEPLTPSSEPIATAVPLTCAVPKVALARTPARPRARAIEMALPERDVIAQRVARFRAAQQKLIRDRDDNYTLVQAKIRASLGNDPSAR